VIILYESCSRIVFEFSSASIALDNSLLKVLLHEVVPLNQPVIHKVLKIRLIGLYGVKNTDFSLEVLSVCTEKVVIVSEAESLLDREL
jgi:hypothetical protein